MFIFVKIVVLQKDQNEPIYIQDIEISESAYWVTMIMLLTDLQKTIYVMY